ncbi:MAG TPA: hypothetical protein EYN03_08915 [Planctomycetes bacterium]|nr:hypothetical protein [Planctomycetaceae bacterium]HIN95753.1 hypothetical protein [Planctomycetota bacterium]
MTRQRADNRVDMRRQELTDLQQDQFLSQLRQTLDKLQRALQQNQYRVTGQVPADHDVVRQASQWIEGLADTIPIAEVANVR